MQIEHFHIHVISLCKFVSQAIVSNHLKQIISNTNQYALSCQSYPKFKSFRNYSNILEIVRGFENKPKIVALIPIFEISTSKRACILVKYNDNHILVSYSRSFWLGLMSTQYSFTCKIFWGHISHIFLMLPSIKL